MSNIKFLLIVTSIFGIVAIALWSFRFFYEIGMIYPICCNIVQFIALIFLYKESKF